MTHERLQEILDAYGANPERWPAEERAAAAALLARTPALREEAARLDVLLDRVPVERPSDGLVERVLADAARTPRRVRPVSRVRPWRAAAAVASLAAAAGLVVWLRGAPARGPGDARNVTIAELGTYATATDVLLDAPGLDVLDAVPTLGCSGNGGLGCPELDVPRARDSLLRTGGSLHA
jgi:hypothetical protein